MSVTDQRRSNRLLKLLERANIKLASGAADAFELSGQLMLRAMIEGKGSPQEMAELAKGRMRAKIPELEPRRWKKSSKSTIASYCGCNSSDSRRQKKTWPFWTNATRRS